ncbi:hypothetical protein UY286_21730 [Paenibacillus polymyxa]|uniref:hypothetical protein n=1 Tax=Paenibacillus polymyxa TaxID=1406 RepID=UPI002AB3E91C|nr:hypothetical protein [Paenibacillus polymyxa]MDY7993338.1 hypothetical protein [Paenibacillus polymyxa]MDY8120061.1 hypothetical protein [Paenibacillus polymyxa]
MNRVTKEIEIKLEPEQRFFVETKDDCSLLLVDSILILPEAWQINLDGKVFHVDYEESEITSGGRVSAGYELNQLGVYDA